MSSTPNNPNRHCLHRYRLVCTSGIKVPSLLSFKSCDVEDPTGIEVVCTLDSLDDPVSMDGSIEEFVSSEDSVVDVDGEDKAGSDVVVEDVVDVGDVEDEDIGTFAVG